MITDLLIKLTESKNIAEDMPVDELIRIADRCAKGVKIDEESCADWLEIVNKGMDIALQKYSVKTSPWQGAANVLFPLITEGAITFAAREYPQIIRGNKVVEAAVFGKDPDGSKQNRAARLSKYMSWQLIMGDNGWEPGTDRLLHMLPVVGTVFRKTYFSPVTMKPVFELCSPDSLIVNTKIKDFDKARRVTHKIYLYKNDIRERINMGLFCDVDMSLLEQSEDQQNGERDEDGAIELHEQHGYLDLDEDGYEEPYIITFHKPSLTVLRIVSRFSLQDVTFIPNTLEIQFIKPRNYFTDFHFLPSPDGSFHSFGYGNLLFPLNHAINTLINQMLDAGTLLNMQFGFIGSGCRIKGGEIKIEAGKFIKVEGAGGMDLSKNIYIPPLHEPSRVLFELLSLLISVSKDLASVSDILQGQALPQNAPATSVLALIKQGLTQYTGVHKRVLASFKKEFTKLYLINCENLNAEEYLEMMNDPQASVADFSKSDLDIRPVADPNMSSDAQRLAQAQAIMQLQLANPLVSAKMYLEALEVPELEIEQLLPPKLPPNPESLKTQAETALLTSKAGEIKAKTMSDAVSQAQAHDKLMMETNRNKSEERERAYKMQLLQAQIGLTYAQTKATESQAVATLSNADIEHKKLARTDIENWVAALKALPDDGGSAMTVAAAAALAPDLDQPTGDVNSGNSASSAPGNQPGSSGGLADSPPNPQPVPDTQSGSAADNGTPPIGG